MAKRQEFDVLIVKDFSRFARDHILVCDYIDQIFPFLGIRFLSINDHYDGAKSNGRTSGIDIGFRNIVYSYYSQDLSKKVKSAKRVKASTGKSVSCKPPFGYQKNEQGQYMIEPVAAKVVQYVFKLAHEGMTIAEVTRRLNREKIPTKRTIKQETIGEKNVAPMKDQGIWIYSEVYRILKEEQYLGKMIYGKSEKVSVSDPKVVPTPKDKWIIVENAHEPLVTEEVFHEILSRISRKKGGSRQQHPWLFRDKIKCGICKRAMTYANTVRPKYSCRTHQEDATQQCFTDVVYVDRLSDTVLTLWKKLIQTYIETENIKPAKTKRSPRDHLDLYKAGLEKVSQKKQDLFEMWIDEKINKEEYTRKNNEQEQAEGTLRQAIAKLESDRKKEVANERSHAEQWTAFVDHAELTKEMVEIFLNCIYVYPNHRLEINWNFSDPSK